MLEKEYGIFRDKVRISPKNVVTKTVKNGQRFSIKKRGKNKYFCFIQERYKDIYCLTLMSKGMPLLKDNFHSDNLKFVGNNKSEVKDFLTKLFEQKNKSITFSSNSINIFE